MSSLKDKCGISGCKEEVTVYYYGYGLCSKHWDKYAELDPNKLKKALGIKVDNEQVLFKII